MTPERRLSRVSPALQRVSIQGWLQKRGLSDGVAAVLDFRVEKARWFVLDSTARALLFYMSPDEALRARAAPRVPRR